MNNLLAENGEVYLLKAFYERADADFLFEHLYSHLAWQHEKIKIFGKSMTVPRLMCWYGDQDAIYRYSGVSHKPLPWLSQLHLIKTKIETSCACNFNSVLANLYRDGRDSMGCHADDEKELGNNPLIASLSLGQTRLFRLSHHQNKQKLDLQLEHGDLLLMAGSTQHNWRHGLPKTAKKIGARINLTYRYIYS